VRARSVRQNMRQEQSTHRKQDAQRIPSSPVPSERGQARFGQLLEHLFVWTRSIKLRKTSECLDISAPPLLKTSLRTAHARFGGGKWSSGGAEADPTSG
jgi:hypothetical protein